MGICPVVQGLDFRTLGYFRRPFTTTPPEVEMTSLKTRLYSPVLFTVITVIASTGAYFRTG